MSYDGSTKNNFLGIKMIEFRTLEFFEQDYCIRLVINLFQQSESDILDLTIKSLYGQY